MTWPNLKREFLHLLLSEADAAMTAQAMDALSNAIGISTESLIRIRTGLFDGRWTFPLIADMINGPLNVSSLDIDGAMQMAYPDEGEFLMPIGLGRSSLLIITQGPLNVAALLDMGVDAIGCESSVSIAPLAMSVKEMSVDCPWRIIAVLVNRHKPGTEKAKTSWCIARTLESRLRSTRHATCIFQPPLGLKTSLQWLDAGGDEDDLWQAIDEQRPRKSRQYDWMKKAGAT